MKKERKKLATESPCNGTRLSGFDLRTKEGRRFQAHLKGITAQVKAQHGYITQMQEETARSWATLVILRERLTDSYLAGEDINIQELLRVINTTTRITIALGLLSNEAVDEGETLEDYLAEGSF